MRRGECAVTYPDSKGPTQALGYMEFADRYGGGIEADLQLQRRRKRSHRKKTLVSAKIVRIQGFTEACQSL
jgi:hypothetical protein